MAAASVEDSDQPKLEAPPQSFTYSDVLKKLIKDRLLLTALGSASCQTVVYHDEKTLIDNLVSTLQIKLV